MDPHARMDVKSLNILVSIEGHIKLGKFLSRHVYSLHLLSDPTI